MSSAKVKMEKFDGRGDYTLWKEKLMAHMDLLGLTVALKETQVVSDPKELEEEGKEPEQGEKEALMEEKRQKARSTIVLSVSDQVLRKIKKEKTAASMLNALDKLYMSKALPNRIYLKQKLYSFKMQENLSVEGNIDEFLRLIADLENTNVLISDEDQAILLLMSLPKQFDQLKDTLKYSSGRATLSVDEVVAAIYSKELELGSNKKSIRGQAEGLYVKEKNETRGRPEQREKGNRNNRSRSRSKEKKKCCWICGEEGHFKTSCPNKGKSQVKGKDQVSSSKGEAAVVKGNTLDGSGLYVSEALHSTDVNLENEWIMDTGCSYHMTHKKEWFEELSDDAGGSVRMGNKTTSKVRGIGNVRIRNRDGSTVLLTQVRYIPDMDRNLLSMGTLEEQGCSFESSNGVLKIKEGNRTLFVGSRHEKLYLLQGKPENGHLLNVERKNDDTVLWHRRLGHISQKNMDILVKKGYLDRKKVSRFEMCEDCIYGKARRLSFVMATHGTEDKLDYVHSDLWGAPSVPLSLGKCQYFISFIDDYSRKVWVYFLKHKDEAFGTFAEWCVMVENQTERKIKILRTDNGLEFCNLQFSEFCKERGIVRHRTCAYTPQQNGVAERMNRTIMEKVRSMLSDSGLPKTFWAEATSTAVTLINKTPSSAINFEIPDKKWSGKPPVYSYLKRFGCVAFVHADEGKLVPRAKKGVFLGYPTGVKGYKVWLMEEKKCSVSRNVAFQENAVYKDLIQKNKDSDQEQEETSSGSLDIDLEETGDMSSGGDLSEETGSLGDHTPSQGSHQPEETEINEEVVNNSPESYHLVRDRVRREIKAPRHFDVEGYYSEFTDDDEEYFDAEALVTTFDGDTIEPANYQEALRNDDWELWKGGMDEEMDSLVKNHTWTVVTKPAGQRVIGCKWIFKRKPGIPGVEKPRFKARLVAKGYAQREGVDYTDIFSPVVKHVSIRILLAIVAEEDYELEQLDVKTAFLHGELEEQIYMEAPEGFESQFKSDQVCLLNKTLYGLKQSPRRWNQKFDSYMLEIGFERSPRDNCAYIKTMEDGSKVYLLLYVDDMLVAARDMKVISELKQKLSEKFEMKDLGAAKKILGMEISRDRVKGTLTLSQEDYLSKVLEVYNMEQCKSVVTPLGAHLKMHAATEQQLLNDEEYMKSVPYSNAVGSIMYSMIGTRPDLAYSVGIISRFMSKPIKEHWLGVKWVLRYIKGSLKMKLCYKKGADFILRGYCDSDYAANIDNRRSTSGMVFTLGGSTINWRSCLQKVVAISTTEAEYMSLTEAVKEAIWLKGLLKDFGYEQKTVEIFCDSQSAIALSKNNVHHDRTKHIDIKYHKIREVIADGVVEVQKISTLINPADIFTKIVPVSKFKSALDSLRVKAE
ncbi:GAG-pre-integrase domain [Arabidopsis suecica]|uniref:GAG-pre-integrase domain n=1 Tax=Arabidopsis suecica TaxID=45249 RepID=A0A8T1Z6S2_ARASU|nr:GAG-pre-integrase domain [Arabidopsis suecica]